MADIGNECDSGTDNETDGESSDDDLNAEDFNSMEAVVKKPSKPSGKKVTHVKNDMVEDKEDNVEVENRKDGEMEIKQLDLNELIENDTSSDDEEESDDENQVEVEKTNPKKLTENGQKIQEKAKVKKDSFFLGAGSDDGSDDEVSDDADDDVMGIVVSQLDWLSGSYTD